ncbi:hypothetical protein KIPB_007872 [Kipferlia bialata]|uniref:Protein kinase domain-containing protein n=1 Tax=Kipferlia bialata TaxID=797122 RepID=A0A9K3CZV2_9EUKA|nr:hypothetical protein KIPB_007872 [Kipferlia bialata]|eukprot:g7872.t1
MVPDGCAPGAPLYNGPECWEYPPSYGYPSDVWALGLVFSQMLTENWVFSKIQNVAQLRHRLMTDCGEITRDHTSIRGLPELVNNMLQADPFLRPTCVELQASMDIIKTHMTIDYLVVLDKRMAAVDCEYLHLTGTHCPVVAKMLRNSSRAETAARNSDTCIVSDEESLEHDPTRGEDISETDSDTMSQAERDRDFERVVHNSTATWRERIDAAIMLLQDLDSAAASLEIQYNTSEFRLLGNNEWNTMPYIRSLCDCSINLNPPRSR